jgi:hypothetical protein
LACLEWPGKQLVSFGLTGIAWKFRKRNEERKKKRKSKFDLKLTKKKKLCQKLKKKSKKVENR